MILVCVNEFGNFEPGDEVEVPDGGTFDQTYFRVKPEPTKKAPAPKGEK